MKPIEKKDMPKLVAVTVAAVALLGLAGYQLTTAFDTKSVKNSSTLSDNVSGETISKATRQLGVDEKDQYVPGSLEALKPGRDPFMVAMAKPSSVAPQGTGNPVQTKSEIQKPKQPEWKASVSTPSKTVATEVKAVSVPPADPPSLRIKGIILGEEGQRDVVVLQGQGGEDDRRFALKGDEVGNGYVVTAIHSRGIELTDSHSPLRDNKVTIKLGNTE